jgi:hypothetical protein
VQGGHPEGRPGAVNVSVSGMDIPHSTAFVDVNQNRAMLSSLRRVKPKRTVFRPYTALLVLTSLFHPTIPTTYPTIKVAVGLTIPLPGLHPVVTVEV